jgi:nucleotide-binding universal stress UspA family protein
MPGWERICCGVDGSEPSRTALEYAVELARVERATLHVLHVRPTYFAPAPFAPPPAPRRVNDDGARTFAGWIARAKRRGAGLVVAIEREGDPAAEIARYAQESDCNVVVLGTHARRGWQRLVLGSVADSVLRSAGCPVLVVPWRRGREEERGVRGARLPDPPLGSEPSGLP